MSVRAGSTTARSRVLCARAEFGSLQAHVFGRSGGADDTHPWLGAGVSLRMRYLSGSAWFLELEPWGVFPLLDAPLVLPQNVTVRSTSPFVGGTTMTFGIHFFR